MVRHPLLDPPPRMLRQFAGLWLAFFGGLAAWQGLVRGGSGSALVLAVAGRRRRRPSA